MVSLENVGARQAFFEQTITRLVSYWSEHEAVKNVDDEFLDEEKDNILKAISVALEVPQAWSTIVDLIVYFNEYMGRHTPLEAWYSLVNKAVEIAKKQGAIESEATLTHTLANICQNSSKPKESIQLYRHAIRLSKASGNRLLKAKTCTTLGNCLVDSGNWWRSEILLCHALKIFEDFDHQQGIAHARRYLGFLYMRQGKWKDSERLHKKAIQIWEEVNDNHRLIQAYSNFGQLYIEMNQPQKALSYLHKALDKAQAVNFTLEFGVLYLNLGYAHLTQGNLEQAEQDLRKAEKILRANAENNSFNLAQVIRHLGDVYEAREDYTRAVEHFELALQRFQAIRHKRIEAWIMTLLAKCQILLNNFAGARKTIQQLEPLIGKLDKELKQKISGAIEKFYAAMNNKAAYEILKNEYTYRIKEQ